MKIEPRDFRALAKAAVGSDAPDARRALIEKELLHYDLLFFLLHGGWLNGLAFQGGTALRLCYKGTRLSEDLDFAGGRGYPHQDMSELGGQLESHLIAIYGLKTHVKSKFTSVEPNVPTGRQVDTWRVKMETMPERPEVPWLEVKFEVGHVPHYTHQPKRVARHYDGLQTAYRNMLPIVQGAHEIMADKMKAFVSERNYVRHRDIWDLGLLSQRGVKPVAGMALQKVRDYRASEGFADQLQARLDALPEIVHSAEFKNEMRNVALLPFVRCLDDPQFLDYLEQNATGLLRGMQSELMAAPAQGQ